MEAPKLLVLVRHAKSSWSHPGLADHDRPLNPRGLRDVPRMAARLAARPPAPDRIVTSSAVRARTTARTFADVLGLDPGSLEVRPELYGAGSEEVLKTVRELDDRHGTVILVGHNPTFTELGNGLSTERIGHVPTCGVVSFRLASKRWTHADWGRFGLVDFDYPKRAVGGRP